LIFSYYKEESAYMMIGCWQTEVWN